MRKSKICKVIALALALVLVFALTACGGNTTSTAPAESEAASQEASAPADESTSPAEVTTLESGKLLVAAEFTYPPFEYMADDGQTEIGLDIDLANAIGEKLGLEVEFISTQFDGIEDGLEIDKYDAVISAYTITAERKEKVDFSQPYIENYQCLVVSTETENPVSDVKELSGHSVAFQTGTTSDKYINNLIDTGDLENVDTKKYDEAMNAFSDLQLGRVDYVICDSSVADIYVAKDPDTYKIVWTQSDTPEQFGIAVKKGNTQLLEAIDTALSELEADGTLDKIKAEWLANGVQA